MPIVPLSTIEPRPVEWLWPGWLAVGCLHLLDGDPGVGKSFLTGDLAARVSTGRQWPDAAGATEREAAAAILLNAEDDAASTTHSRLTAAGAEMSRVLVWRDGDAAERVRLPGRVGPLRAAIERSGARLVVIDPVTAFLDRGVGFCSDPEVRRALLPLAELADETRCAIVLVRHLSKAASGLGQGRAMMAGLGSVGWIASVRVAWLAGADPKIPGFGVLAPLKNNIGPMAVSISYRLNRATSTVDWLGGTHLGARDLVRSLSRAGSVLGRARAFVRTMVAEGRRTASDVYAAGEREGFSRRTLRRAAKAVGVLVTREGNQRGEQVTWWSFAEVDGELKRWLDEGEREAG